MTKKLIVDGAATSVDVVTAERIEARAAYVSATKNDRGVTQRYAISLMASFGEAPLFWKDATRHAGFVAEVAAYKGACGDDVPKATLRKRVQYVREELDRMAGIEKSANVTKDVFTRITDDETKLYKALMAAELATQWANDDLANLAAILRRHKVDVTTLG
jgi:hypothetical protein